MPSVYLEKTIPSYLAAHPSRDLVIAAHQQITHDWWRTATQRFGLYVSDAVLAELGAGDRDAAGRRLKFVERLPVLAYSDDVAALVEAYKHRLGLVGRAAADLAHVAFSVAYKLDYLVTWNCRHLANGETIRKLREANEDLQRNTPIIVTPEELIDPDEELQ